MEYQVQLEANKERATTPIYHITCKDHEARTFLKAINKELKRMRAERKRELRKGLKEGIRANPHVPMTKQGDTFSFSQFQLDDVFTAAESLSKQRSEIRSSFMGPVMEINPSILEDFEKAIAEPATQAS